MSSSKCQALALLSVRTCACACVRQFTVWHSGSTFRAQRRAQPPTILCGRRSSVCLRSSARLGPTHSVLFRSSATQCRVPDQWGAPNDAHTARTAPMATPVPYMRRVVAHRPCLQGTRTRARSPRNALSSSHQCREEVGTESSILCTHCRDLGKHHPKAFEMR